MSIILTKQTHKKFAKPLPEMEWRREIGSQMAVERGLVGLLYVLSLFVQLLPIRGALFLGRMAGFSLYVTKRSRIAYANLKAAFKSRYSAKERKAIIRKHFEHLGQNMVEVLRFPKMDQRYFEQFILAEHRERYEQAVSSGRGTVLLTPHFGNWELSQVLSALVGKPLHILARGQKHSQLDDFLNRLRTAHGSIAVLKGSAVRSLIRVLRKGGAVGALGDLSGGRSGALVRFFGRRTTAPTGIFEITARTNAVLLPCFIVRENGPFHKVYVEPPFPVHESEETESVLQESILRYYALLESWIERFPEQLFWVYKRWKYCYTKRVLVLHDDKAGHNTQSDAIAKEFERLQT